MASELFQEAAVTVGCLVPTDSPERATEIARAWAEDAVEASVPRFIHVQIRSVPPDYGNENVAAFTRKPHPKEGPAALCALHIRLRGPSEVNLDLLPLIAALEKAPTARFHVLYLYPTASPPPAHSPA
jgi:hypothetical protein